MAVQFFLIGMAHFANSAGGRRWVQNIATAMYAVASSSGSIFFALNFGDEGQISIHIILPKAVILKFIRWCPCQSMGLPCLRHPRHSTSLRRRPLVLGLYTHQGHRLWHHASQPGR